MEGTARPLYWLITRRYDNSWLDVLLIGLPDGEEVLPIFSFEEEAGMFLRLGAWGTGWQARETTARELVSVLLGPCASVERVVLDPVPEIGAKVMVAFVGMGREDFLNRIIGEEGKPLDPAAKRHALARASHAGLCRSADVNKGVVAEA